MGPVTPRVSIVVPVHDEERILAGATEDLVLSRRALGVPFEILLAENGSRDRTAELARALGDRFPEVRTFSVPDPNYGRALRQGILRARGAIVVCEEIDLGDVAFHRRAEAMLDDGSTDFVIGSKLLAGSRDERPLGRHVASLAYNAMLRTLLGFRGTDTHGLKAFLRAPLLPIVASCLVDRDVFASELVIRADRAGLRVREIAVDVREKRPPSVDLLRRVPAVVRQVGRLTWSIRFHRGS